MTGKINKSDRKLAAFWARRYLSGKISKKVLFDRIQSLENDFKIQELIQKIKEKPKTGWLFGVSKSSYENFLKETYEIINELECENFQFKTLKSLFNMLWIQSNNCSEVIENIGYLIFEVSKMTCSTKSEVIMSLNLLLNEKYIEIISTEPLLYQFTEKGKKVKTDTEIDEIIKIHC